MYLEGHKYVRAPYNEPEKQLKEDGFPVSKTILELGYWRKHPNLHGYIVNTFASGVDNCEAIFLNRDDLLQIITAIETNQLPQTTGFFFGESDPSRDLPTIEILRKAINWLDSKPDNPLEVRMVYYQASW